MQTQVIELHPRAPSKPPVGAPCNGCGWCCAAEPCPLGRLVSGRRRGRCRALAWDEPGQRYRCGLLAESEASADFLRRLPTRLFRRLVSRSIGAGRGCDSDATEEVPAAQPGTPGPCVS